MCELALKVRDDPIDPLTVVVPARQVGAGVLTRALRADGCWAARAAKEKAKRHLRMPQVQATADVASANMTDAERTTVSLALELAARLDGSDAVSANSRESGAP